MPVCTKPFLSVVTDAKESTIAKYEFHATQREAEEHIEKYIGTQKSGAGCVFEARTIARIQPTPILWGKAEVEPARHIDIPSG